MSCVYHIADLLSKKVNYLSVTTKHVDVNSLPVKRRLDALQHDNTDPVYRPAGKRVLEKLVPVTRKLLFSRGKELPQDLRDLEMRYLERISWQRSRYVYKVLLNNVQKFTETLNFPKLTYDPLKDIEDWIPIQKIKSTSYDLKTEGHDMTKSAGLPKFGSKKENLAAAKQYLSSLGKPGLSDLYPAFLGYRTQQSPEDDPKVRNINMVPITTWLLEIQMLDSAIANAKANWISTDRTTVHYTDLNTAFQWICDKISQCQSVVMLDASNYDMSVYQEEISGSLRLLAPEYEHIEVLIEYYNTAPILAPIGYILRKGGILSGTVGTNILDSITNILDIVRACELIGLARYIIGIRVNGDDIVVFLSTQARSKNINDIDKGSKRTISEAKSSITTSSAWFSKIYFDPGLPGPTKPVHLVVNSLAFKERESDAVTSSKEYAAIAATQILGYLEHHPWGTIIRDEYWRKCDKYPISGFDANDPQVREVAGAYLSRHNWAVETGQLPSDPVAYFKELQSSWAAEGV